MLSPALQELFPEEIRGFSREENTGKILIHIDMDSFYASVEMQRHPELEDKPLVIGADPKGGHGRGVVSTCSYKAREFGIRSAMPVSQAYRLCPHAVFLPPDYSWYTHISQCVMEILRGFGFRLLQASIDEAFLDVSTLGSYNIAEGFAVRIQESIKTRLGLTCSVGIGPGKTVAKIASDYRKPAGRTVVLPETVREFLAPLPVRKIPGVGRRAEVQLLELGIRTIGDLADADIQVLMGRLGRGAVPLYELAQGLDTGDIGGSGGIKSLSREITFERDTDDPALLSVSLAQQVDDVHESLIQEHLRFRTITVKVRYQDFVTRTRSHTLSHRTDEKGPVLSWSQSLLQEMLDSRKVRLLGIRLSSLELPDARQALLDL